jgi:phosphoribosylanthranilate isomerase
MLIKICGLRSVEHALVAATAGASLLGLVFAPSPRQVSLEEARVIVAAVRTLPQPHPILVGLFVNTTPATVNAVAAQLGLDRIQLSGNEPASDTDLITLPIIKTVRMDGSPHEQAWLARPEVATGRLLFLADAHVPGRYGGTGARADWGRAAELAMRVPLLLAGGLNAENVAAAIAEVRPLGVDVSSGVEHAAGQKDSARIEAFITAALAHHADTT